VTAAIRPGGRVAALTSKSEVAVALIHLRDSLDELLELDRARLALALGQLVDCFVPRPQPAA
jgi:hypothetical protein